MAAQNKADLLDIHRKEFTKLDKLVGDISDDVALLKDDEDTSIKDVLTHRAHWIGLFLGWYADGLAGKQVFFPAEGYKWNDLKRYNEDLRAQHADVNWHDAVQALHDAYAQLTDFLERRSNRELYGGPMKGANNQWTPGRWAEAAGPSHFRSASKYIRARLRALK
ncbi:MAG: ClbS/DfsB family four-helix bundle protein [Pseudomonadota bacterium]